MSKKSILYISGDGHSGSTLLDIILGSRKKSFSAGELAFLPQKGIKNKEFCACGQPVPECSIWSEIIREWNKKRNLTLDEYIRLQAQLTSKKHILSSYKLLKHPSGKTELFLKDTRMLYDIIFDRTKTSTIVDSSKTPGRILILKNLGFDVTVIHLTRRFGDVLNSNKRHAKKNLEAGIEHDIKPRKTTYIMPVWMIKNLLTVIYSKGIKYKKIKYEEIVADPALFISRLVDYDEDFKKKLEQRGPFYPLHLVAGNAIRMKDHLFIADKPMNTSYHRLNRKEKYLAGCVDFFY